MEKKALLVRMDPQMVQALDYIAAMGRERGGNESRASLIRIAVDAWLDQHRRDHWPDVPFMCKVPEPLGVIIGQ